MFLDSFLSLMGLFVATLHEIKEVPFYPTLLRVYHEWILNFIRYLPPASVEIRFSHLICQCSTICCFSHLHSLQKTNPRLVCITTYPLRCLLYISVSAFPELSSRFHPLKPALPTLPPLWATVIPALHLFSILEPLLVAFSAHLIFEEVLVV